MKYFVSVLLMGLLLMAAQYGPRLINSGKTTYRYSIQLDAKSQTNPGEAITWLQKHEFDIAGINWKKYQIEVITTDDGLDLLKQNAYTGRILEKRIPGTPSRISFDPQYLNPAKVEQKLQELNAQFPQRTRLEKLGTSSEGRAIWGLLLSTTPQAKDKQYFEKPTIIMDGLHHAREIMTPEIVIDVAETLLKSPTPRMTEILDHWNIWLVPMLNVDGSNVVWTKNSWWRKNARARQNTVFGVDVNRNYPYKWSACNGSSGYEASDTYRGPSAGSEMETNALVQLAQATHPTAYLSYHSFSELILYPYGCTRDFTGEAKMYESIGKELAQLLPADANDGTFYRPGVPWQILYGVDGDSMSYMYSEFGATSFTFEVNQEFQPEYALRAPTLEKHRKAWSYFLNRMDQNMLALKIFDGKTNQTTAATVEISTIAQLKGEKPFRTNPAGIFFKALDPGTYTLRVRLSDGRQKDLNVQMTGKPLVENVVVN